MSECEGERRRAIDRILEIESLPPTEERQAEWRALHVVAFGTVVDGGHQDTLEDIGGLG